MDLIGTTLYCVFFKLTCLLNDVVNEENYNFLDQYYAIHKTLKKEKKKKIGQTVKDCLIKIAVEDHRKRR